jgi:hypothetical protein
MNTNELKRFAREARIKLIDQVGRKLDFVLSNADPVFLDTNATQIQSLKNKIRTSATEHLLHIKSFRDRWPAVTLYELGVKADIELNLMSRTKGEVPDEATRRRRMTIAVRRLLTNAERLVANAGMGKFPSFQKHS